MNTRKHMRTNGGVQPRTVLTCCDAWPQAWTRVTRTNTIHTCNASPSTAAPRYLLTAQEENAEAARMIAAGWQAWEVCAALGCDQCRACRLDGCDQCARWAA